MNKTSFNIRKFIYKGQNVSFVSYELERNHYILLLCLILSSFSLRQFSDKKQIFKITNTKAIANLDPNMYYGRYYFLLNKEN